MVALCNGHVDVGAGTVASLGPAAVHQHGLDLGVLGKDGRDDAAVGSCQSEFHCPSDSLCWCKLCRQPFLKLLELEGIGFHAFSQDFIRRLLIVGVVGNHVHPQVPVMDEAGRKAMANRVPGSHNAAGVPWYSR